MEGGDTGDLADEVEGGDTGDLAEEVEDRDTEDLADEVESGDTGDLAEEVEGRDLADEVEGGDTEDLLEVADEVEGRDTGDLLAVADKVEGNELAVTDEDKLDIILWIKINYISEGGSTQAFVLLFIKTQISTSLFPRHVYYKNIFLEYNLAKHKHAGWTFTE